MASALARFAPQRSVRTLRRKLGPVLSTRAIGSLHEGTEIEEEYVMHEPQESLVSPSDWLEFQSNRAQYKTLIDVMSKYGSTQTRETSWKLRDSFHKPAANATVSALLASGAHFGHSTSKMNSNFMPYAYGERAGITVIDLDHTLPLLRRAANLVRAVASNGGQIVFIGTRPDIRPIVEKASQRMGEQAYHVGERWLPGTLTNRHQLFEPEVTSSTKIIPDLVVLLNPLANMTAIYECAKEHVPTIGIIDSNVDPRIVMYPIPANDESTRTAELVAGVLSIAGREGVELRKEKDRLKKERAAEQERYEGSQRSRRGKLEDEN